MNNAVGIDVSKNESVVTILRPYGEVVVSPFKIYPTIPLKTLYLQGFSPFTTAHFMYFPLFLPLRAETRESFYSPPTTLSSNLAELRFASLVA